MYLPHSETFKLNSLSWCIPILIVCKALVCVHVQCIIKKKSYSLKLKHVVHLSSSCWYISDTILFMFLMRWFWFLMNLFMTHFQCNYCFFYVTHVVHHMVHFQVINIGWAWALYWFECFIWPFISHIYKYLVLKMFYFLKDKENLYFKELLVLMIFHLKTQYGNSQRT